jgi:hypothetical protein
MPAFIAMLAAMVVRDSNPDNQNLAQISNGVIAISIMSVLTKG